MCAFSLTFNPPNRYADSRIYLRPPHDPCRAQAVSIRIGNMNPLRSRSELPPEHPDAKSRWPCGVTTFCPHPCPEVLQNPWKPCPAVCQLANHHQLTDRERQVLWLVRLGLKNSAIASQLHISLPTVRHHLRNIHSKTDTSDKLEVVNLAWQFCIKHIKQPLKKNRKTYRKR